MLIVVMTPLRYPLGVADFCVRLLRRADVLPDCVVRAYVIRLMAPGDDRDTLFREARYLGMRGRKRLWLKWRDRFT